MEYLLKEAFLILLTELNDVSYLPNEMLHSSDPANANQLRDCTKNVYQKEEKYSVSEVFSCKLKFVINVCKRWIDEKFKTNFRELDLFSKQMYRKENRINWRN